MTEKISSISQFIEALRQQGRNITPAEIAQQAQNARLSVRDTVRAIADHLEIPNTRSRGMTEILPCLISSLCRNDGCDRILVYTRIPFLLTDFLTGRNERQKLSLVVPERQAADALRIIFEGSEPSVFDNVNGLSPDAKYSVIACIPPLEMRRPDDTIADGFGGEIVRQLMPYLSKEGVLYWITGQGVLFNPRARQTFADLEAMDVHTAACIEMAPGSFPGTMIPGAAIALRFGKREQRFDAVLRDPESVTSTAAAFRAGPTRTEGPNWAWFNLEDRRAFRNLERSRLLQRLRPRGRHTEQPLSALLHDIKIEKSDRPLAQTHEAVTFLYVPEYAESRVTADLDEQTVKPSAVYRLAIDPTKANSRFLAQLLNTAYGKELRRSVASGATIQRVPAASLLALRLPIPDIKTQERIARIGSDIGLLQATFREMRDILDQDWTKLPDVSEKIDSLKAVLDIEQRIANWWRELPYPLATVYRRYKVSVDPKESLETLFNFFELMAVYLAAIGTSHVSALRSDWREVLPNWLHPPKAAGIERADFGFWIKLAGESLKDMSRVASEKNLRAAAEEHAGLELVQIAPTVSVLRKAVEPLEVARGYRNKWKGHGGYMKPIDASRLDAELQESVRGLYEVTASIFRDFQLVRPGVAEITDEVYRFQIERLTGSDPTFEKEWIELDRGAKSKALSFWMKGARTLCRSLPFFRLGTPQQPQETSFYVFNRVEDGGFRWISYQEATQQDFVEKDDELLSIISLGKAVG